MEYQNESFKDDNQQAIKENKYIKLDYSLASPEERTKLVSYICENTPKKLLTSYYLTTLANYIIGACEKQEKIENKGHKQNNLLLTQNRLLTINKHEISLQNLASKFEAGEDGIYNMVIMNDKNIIFSPKIEITSKDIESIQPLKELVESIKKVEEEFKKATGKRKYLLKQQIIEMRKEQYIIKAAYQKPIAPAKMVKNFNQINLEENLYIDKNGDIQSKGLISFINPKHISTLLNYYSQLKENSYGNFQGDCYYMMLDFDNLVKDTLKEEPMYNDIIIYKIDGMSNEYIQNFLKTKYGITYSIEYISSLWKNKIPKLIAEKAEEKYLTWYYTEKEKGKWKKCACCGEIKLAHSKFFSKNSTSKDGFYSHCKQCRSKKYKNKKTK